MMRMIQERAVKKKAGSGLWEQKVMEGEDKKVMQVKGRQNSLKGLDDKY